MTGGGDSANGVVYSFTIPDQGGFDPAGNLKTVQDSVMGNWSYSYDNLNRLASAAGTLPVNTSASFYSNYCWAYDGFGNRTMQDGSTEPFTNAIGAPACAAQSSALLDTDLAAFNANNQMTATNARGVAVVPTYDAAGNVTYDTLNQYLYDGVPSLALRTDAWSVQATACWHQLRPDSCKPGNFIHCKILMTGPPAGAQWRARLRRRRG